jgi:hypothetical protein
VKAEKRGEVGVTSAVKLAGFADEFIVGIEVMGTSHRKGKQKSL